MILTTSQLQVLAGFQECGVLVPIRWWTSGTMQSGYPDLLTNRLRLAPHSADVGHRLKPTRTSTPPHALGARSTAVVRSLPSAYLDPQLPLPTRSTSPSPACRSGDSAGTSPTNLGPDPCCRTSGSSSSRRGTRTVLEFQQRRLHLVRRGQLSAKVIEFSSELARMKILSMPLG